MIVVRKTETGFERIGGNPVINSLDGTRKSPLRTILHSSWTPEERAAYGIYIAKPFEAPDGKLLDGAESFEERDGVVSQVIPVKDVVKEQPKTNAQKAEDLAKRVGLTLAELKAELDKV